MPRHCAEALGEFRVEREREAEPGWGAGSQGELSRGAKRNRKAAQAQADTVANVVWHDSVRCSRGRERKG